MRTYGRYGWRRRLVLVPMILASTSDASTSTGGTRHHSAARLLRAVDEQAPSGKQDSAEEDADFERAFGKAMDAFGSLANGSGGADLQAAAIGALKDSAPHASGAGRPQDEGSGNKDADDTAGDPAGSIASANGAGGTESSSTSGDPGASMNAGAGGTESSSTSGDPGASMDAGAGGSEAGEKSGDGAAEGSGASGGEDGSKAGEEETSSTSSTAKPGAAEGSGASGGEDGSKAGEEETSSTSSTAKPGGVPGIDTPILVPGKPGPPGPSGIPGKPGEEETVSPSTAAKEEPPGVCYGHRTAEECHARKNMRCNQCVWVEDSTFGGYCSDPACGHYTTEEACCGNKFGVMTGCVWIGDARTVHHPGGVCQPKTCQTVAVGLCGQGDERSYMASNCANASARCSSYAGCHATCAGCRPREETCNCNEGPSAQCGMQDDTVVSTRGLSCPVLECYRCLQEATTIEGKEMLRKPGGDCALACNDVVHCEKETACLSSIWGGSGSGDECSIESTAQESCDSAVDTSVEVLMYPSTCEESCSMFESLCGGCAPKACTMSQADIDAARKAVYGAPGADGAPVPGIDTPIIVPGPPGAQGPPGKAGKPPPRSDGETEAQAKKPKAGPVRGVDYPIYIPGPPGPPGPPGKKKRPSTPAPTESPTQTRTQTSTTRSTTTVSATSVTVTQTSVTTETTATVTETSVTVTETTATTTVTRPPAPPTPPPKKKTPMPPLPPPSAVKSIHHVR